MLIDTVLLTRDNKFPARTFNIKFCFPPLFSSPGDLTVSKRTGTSNIIEIQFRTFNHLSRPDSFVKLFVSLCLCLAQGNQCLGQI